MARFTVRMSRRIFRTVYIVVDTLQIERPIVVRTMDEATMACYAQNACWANIQRETRQANDAYHYHRC